MVCGIEGGSVAHLAPDGKKAVHESDLVDPGTGAAKGSADEDDRGDEPEKVGYGRVGRVRRRRSEIDRSLWIRPWRYRSLRARWVSVGRRGE